MKRTLVLLATAEGADILTTLYGLTHGTHEANPTSAVVIATVGLGAWALAKSWPIPAVVIVGTLYKGQHREMFFKGARIGALMLLGVVASNVLTVLR